MGLIQCYFVAFEAVPQMYMLSIYTLVRAMFSLEFPVFQATDHADGSTGHTGLTGDVAGQHAGKSAPVGVHVR